MLLDNIRKAGIRLEDTDYIDLFADFGKMVLNGEKVSYAVAVLADEYGISERTVYSIIKRLQRDCNFGAV